MRKILKKSLAVVLAASMLVPAYVSSSSKVDAASVGIKKMYSSNYYAKFSVVLNDNKDMFFIKNNKATKVLSDVVDFRVNTTTSNYTIAAIMSDGSVYSWGSYGYFTGTGETRPSTPVDTPTKLNIPEKVVKLYGTWDSTFALTESGSLYGWGYNRDGMLGVGHSSIVYVPTQTIGPGNSGVLTGVLDLYVSRESVVAKTATKLYSWGNNESGQLGRNTSVVGSAFYPDVISGLPTYTDPSTVSVETLDEDKMSDDNTMFNITTGNFGREGTVVANIGATQYYWGADPYKPRQGGRLDPPTLQTTAKAVTGNKLGALRQTQVSMLKINGYSNTNDNTKIFNNYLTRSKDGTVSMLGMTHYSLTSLPTAPTFPTYITTATTVLTGVKKSLSFGAAAYLLRNDGTLYGYGINEKSSLGYPGATQQTAVKVNGTLNELANGVKDIQLYDMNFSLGNQSFSNSGSTTTYNYSILPNAGFVYALKDNGDLYNINAGAYNQVAITKIASDVVKFAAGHEVLYVDSTGQLRSVTSTGVVNTITDADQVTTPATPVAPDEPVSTVSGVDADNKSIITVDFGSNAASLTKEYRVNGGSWQAYTGPVTIDVSGNVKFESRATDSNGNSSTINELNFTNNPVNNGGGGTNPGNGGITPTPGGSTDITTTSPLPVLAGALTISGNQMAFTQVQLQNGKAIRSTASTSFIADDSRGNGAGWNVSSSSTDFTQEVADPTNVGKKMTVAIPVSRVSYVLKDLESVGGQDLEGITNATATKTTMLKTPQNMVSASVGRGMGTFKGTLDFDVDVPNEVRIDAVEAGSSLNVGDDIGTFSGTYTATVTLTISTGP